MPAFSYQALDAAGKTLGRLASGTKELSDGQRVASAGAYNLSLGLGTLLPNLTAQGLGRAKKLAARLEGQAKGASAALRDLVETAMRATETVTVKPNIDAIYRIMSVMAGNLPGFEEASRALYKSEWEKFRTLIAAWPKDVRQYLEQRLVL